MKKKINFKKSWTYILILSIIFAVTVTFEIGVNLASETLLDTIIGDIYGYDITARFMICAISLYCALTLVIGGTLYLIKWCFEHIVIE